MLEAVIWDVDGTLVATKDLYLECYRRALEPFAGRLFSDDELLAMKPHSELRLLQGHAGDRYEACIAEFNRHYAELHPTHFGGVYDGIPEVLQDLRARGIRNGIVTGKSRSSWSIMITHVELGAFDAEVLDDDVQHPKPHPEGILAALGKLKVDPQRAIYVGDSPGDMEAAVAAGTRAGAAMWSKNQEWRKRFMERVRGLNGLEILEQPEDVLALVRQ